MNNWVVRNYILDRPGLRLSVSLDDKRTWCWFVYQREHPWNWPVLTQGTSETFEEAQAAASEWADRHAGRVCTRCGLTETETRVIHYGYCAGGQGVSGREYIEHPAGPEQSSQHHFPEEKTP